jgi:hypothetical protein
MSALADEKVNLLDRIFRCRGKQKMKYWTDYPRRLIGSRGRARKKENKRDPKYERRVAIDARVSVQNQLKYNPTAPNHAKRFNVQGTQPSFFVKQKTRPTIKEKNAIRTAQRPPPRLYAKTTSQTWLMTSRSEETMLIAIVIAVFLI